MLRPAAGSDALRGDPIPSRSAGPAPGADPASRLVGRAEEWQRVRTFVARLPAAGGAFVVRGEPGIGKSALVACAAREAHRRGVPAVSITVPQSESGIPYASLQQLLHPFEHRLVSLRARPRSVLERALGRIDGEPPELFAVGVAVLECVADIAADRGLLAVVDDAHWMDEATAQVLAFVARRIAGDPVAMVFALRDGYPSPILDPNLERLDVPPLDEAGARTLLSERRPELTGAEVAGVLRLSGGNPLALLELPPSVDAPGERSVGERLEAAFLARLGEVDEATRTVLLLAAVDDGDRIDEVRAAARAAGIEDPAIDRAIERATTSRILGVDGARFVFRHPLVRSALVSAASPVLLQRAHDALARATEHDPDRSVWHAAAAAAGRDDAIGNALEQAAVRAAARGDLALSRRAWELAADLATSPGVVARRRLRGAELAVELGRPDLAAAVRTTTRGDALSAEDAARLALLRVTTAREAQSPARIAQLARHGERALEAGAVELAVAVTLTAGEHLDAGGHRGDAAVGDLAARVAARLPDGDVRRLAVLAAADPTPYLAAISSAVRRIDPAEAIASAELLVRVRTNVDADRDMADLQRRLIDVYRSRGQLRSIAFLQPTHAWNEITLANWPEALRAAEEGTRLALDVGAPRWGTGTLIAEAYIAAVRGDTATAAVAIEESERGAVLAGATNVLTGVQLTKGVDHIAQGRYEEAFAALRRTFDPADPAHHPVQIGWCLGDLAESAAHLGRLDEIRPLFDRDRSLPTTPWQAMAEEYAQPFLAIGDADTEDAFARALSGSVAGWPTYRARLQLEYGVWLRRQRRVAEARVQLRLATELLDALVLRPWAGRARAELRATGGEVPRAQPAAWESLSAQELQVAELAAKGLHNREIAERLFLSHRTVGSHLYRIFPKLGITNRGQLASLLGPARAVGEAG